MSTEMSKRIIVIDLDNTLADYTGGWENHKDFPGPPRQDVVTGLRQLQSAGYVMGILTTRDQNLVYKWLDKYELGSLIEFVNDSPHQPPEAGKHKPIAFAYIDDRAIRYEGDNMSDIVEGILKKKYIPWNQKIVTNLTDKTFFNEVEQSESPLLIEFWAEWCMPCDIFAPILQELSNEYKGAIKIVRANTEECMGIVVKMGIHSLPALFFMNKGKVIRKLNGYQHKNELKIEINKFLETLY